MNKIAHVTNKGIKRKRKVLRFHTPLQGHATSDERVSL
jgi:hypothetical protein